MIRRFAWLLAATCAAVALASCRTGEVAPGGRAYLAQCAVCHGSEGRGDGPLASTIAAEGKRPPAILDGARVRALGRHGLFRTLESGVHVRGGSPMPVWGPHLGPTWTGRIADYLLAQPAQGEAGRAAVAGYLAAPPGTPPTGRRVYVLYCSGCHGPQGGGDGFVSPHIRSRLAVAPLDSAALARFDDAELARRIQQGGAHAPKAETMPGWLYTLSPDDRAALLGYMRTLSGSVQSD